jgi:serine/threonine protein kinase
VVLDASRRVLKIADFGEAEVFKGPYDKDVHLSTRRVGSKPYIAPEEYIQPQFDPRAADIWSCAVIHLVMRFKRFPWNQAKLGDPIFHAFSVKKPQEFYLIRLLNPGPRDLLCRMLDLNPETRIQIRSIFRDDWFKTIVEKE